jgi:hypothetical protein
MGQTSADVQRDIESVRADLSASLTELERRARELAELPGRAGSNPAVRALAGAGALALLAAVGARVLAARRARQQPTHKLRRQTERLRSDLGERWGWAREAIPYTITRRSQDESEAHYQKPSRFKSLLWMGLTAGLVALYGLLARRASAAVWQAVMHEEPPSRKI